MTKYIKFWGEKGIKKYFIYCYYIKIKPITIFSDINFYANIVRYYRTADNIGQHYYEQYTAQRLAACVL